MDRGCLTPAASGCSRRRGEAGDGRHGAAAGGGSCSRGEASAWQPESTPAALSYNAADQHVELQLHSNNFMGVPFQSRYALRCPSWMSLPLSSCELSPDG
ncbi:unnamed protein product [Urochloa humidicola]